MKTTKKQSATSPRKAIIITLAALLVITGALAIYVYAFGGNLFGWQPNKQSSTSPTSTSTSTEAPTPAQQETNATTGESTNNSAKNNTPETTTPTTDTLVVSFTNWSTTGVRVIIEGAITGNCTLKLTRPGTEPITMTAATFQSGASSTTCQGFNYDILTGGGWTATVTVTAGNATGSASKAL